MSQAQGPSTGENPAETYERYFVPAMFVPWARELIERASPRLGDRVLDVACGTGVVSRQVAQKVGPTGSVVGLDINPAMLGVARSVATAEAGLITWQEGSATALPFREAEFDLVLCQQGLQFFPDRVAAVREMRRVLKRDGQVAILVNQALQNNPVYEALYSAIAGRLETTAAAIASPFALGDADELHGLIEGAGFRHVKVEPVTLTVHFPEPSRWVQLAVLSSAAVLPVFGQMEPAERKELVQPPGKTCRFRRLADGPCGAT